MVTVSYNNGIPDGPNNPSADQPLMKVNTNAIDTILQQDHVSFNAANGGTHKQVTFSSENTPSTPIDPVSLVYTTPGIASSVADLRFINANSTFPVSLIRAYAVCDSSGAFVGGQNMNVTSVTHAGNQYNIILNAGTVTGTAFGITSMGNIIGMTGPSPSPSFFALGANSFSMIFYNLSSPVAPTQFTFIVYQL